MRSKVLFILLFLVLTSSLLAQKNGIRYFFFPGWIYNYISLGYERQINFDQTIEIEAQAGAYFYIFYEESISYGRIKAGYKKYFPYVRSKNSFWLGYHLVMGKSNSSSFGSLGSESFKDFGTGFSIGRRNMLYGNPQFWLELGLNYNLLLKEKYKKTEELPDMVSVIEVEITDKYAIKHRLGGILNLIYRF